MKNKSLGPNVHRKGPFLDLLLNNKFTARLERSTKMPARRAGCSKAALLARSGGAKGARDQTSE